MLTKNVNPKCYSMMPDANIELVNPTVYIPFQQQIADEAHESNCSSKNGQTMDRNSQNGNKMGKNCQISDCAKNQ